MHTHFKEMSSVLKTTLELDSVVSPQSPIFRLQRKLESQVTSMKMLNKEVHEMQMEKEQWLVERLEKEQHIRKLEQQSRLLKENNVKLHQERDNLESCLI